MEKLNFLLFTCEDDIQNFGSDPIEGGGGVWLVDASSCLLVSPVHVLFALEAIGEEKVEFL